MSAYYYRTPQLYANQQLDDVFLESLSEDGFQVGEAAKVCYGVPECDTIAVLGYDEALMRPREIFPSPNVNIANGGAALTAYSELQFSDDLKSEALAKAPPYYCGLDTMVFIWEYFFNEVYNQ